jgi:hypothetical protein
MTPPSGPIFVDAGEGPTDAVADRWQSLSIVYWGKTCPVRRPRERKVLGVLPLAENCGLKERRLKARHIAIIHCYTSLPQKCSERRH